MKTYKQPLLRFPGWDVGAEPFIDSDNQDYTVTAYVFSVPFEDDASGEWARAIQRDDGDGGMTWTTPGKGIGGIVFEVFERDGGTIFEMEVPVAYAEHGALAVEMFMRHRPAHPLGSAACPQCHSIYLDPGEAAACCPAYRK
jgi:hypothetical protein